MSLISDAVNQATEAARKAEPDDGNRQFDAAVAHLAKAATANKELAKALLHAACVTLIRGNLPTQRRRTARKALQEAFLDEQKPPPPRTYVKENDPLGKVMLMAKTSALLMWPLRRGLFLRDARRSDVSQASSHYIEQGREMVGRGIVLREIEAELAPDDSNTVFDVRDRFDWHELARRFNGSEPATSPASTSGEQPAA